MCSASLVRKARPRQAVRDAALETLISRFRNNIGCPDCTSACTGNHAAGPFLSKETFGVARVACCGGNKIRLRATCAKLLAAANDV